MVLKLQCSGYKAHDLGFRAQRSAAHLGFSGLGGSARQDAAAVVLELRGRAEHTDLHVPRKEAS